MLQIDGHGPEGPASRPSAPTIPAFTHRSASARFRWIGGALVFVMLSAALEVSSQESAPFITPRPQQAQPISQNPEPFTLGVLRRDGIVIPFAAFDGKRWSAPWPEDTQFLELPISIDAIPGKWWGKAGAPTELTIWSNGARQGPVRLTGPAILPIMCVRRLGLYSTYKPLQPPPPRSVQPYPKDGLVISGSQPIAPIDIVPRTSPLWQSTAVALVEPFNAAETTAIKAFTDWKHPIARADRVQVPVELETLYSAPMDTPGWTAYHVEGVKHYRPGKTEGDCGLVTYASGWLLRGPNGDKRVALGAQVSYCDRRDNTFMLPLGLIQLAERSYWVYQVSGYEREGYAVSRLIPRVNQIEAQYTAGACFR
jgi:hypothetical protein